jgi:hypothetical protein
MQNAKCKMDNDTLAEVRAGSWWAGARKLACPTLLRWKAVLGEVVEDVDEVVETLAHAVGVLAGAEAGDEGVETQEELVELANEACRFPAQLPALAS